jgi:hypothetical protein
MTADTGVTHPVAVASRAAEGSEVYTEGIRAGLTGAVTIALWFFLIDVIRGHPLYTPSVLGTALLKPGTDAGTLAALPVSFEMVVSFTWIHVLVFLLIGVAAAHLLALAERNPSAGFGIVLLFVVFQCGFMIGCMLFAEPVIHLLTWPAILVGNLLAAGAMAASFWRRHPSLTVLP